MKTTCALSVRANACLAGAAGPDSGGFTLIELLVVIATTAILAALLLPGLARGNQQVEGDQCMNNLRLLSEGWLMFNSDNQGNFPASAGEGAQGADNPQSPDLRPGGTNAQWCPGQQDPGIPPGNWLSPGTLSPGAPNVGWEWIQAGLIYPYVKNVQVYLCPSDESFNTIAGIRYPHVRSESMNVWLNPLGTPSTFGGEDASLRVYRKESDLTVPGPANTMLFVDENPNSINDASFLADPTYPNTIRPAWIDCPGSFHNGAGGISFCDGHLGLKKWHEPIVLAQTSMNGAGSFLSRWTGGPSKYLPDILWIVNRSTALKSTTSFLGPQGW